MLMNILSVYCHHEPSSLTSSLKNTATSILVAQGHEPAEGSARRIRAPLSRRPRAGRRRGPRRVVGPAADPSPPCFLRAGGRPHVVGHRRRPDGDALAAPAGVRRLTGRSAPAALRRLPARLAPPARSCEPPTPPQRDVVRGARAAASTPSPASALPPETAAATAVWVNISRS